METIPGLMLAPGEVVLDRRTFAWSTLLFFLNVHFVTTNRRVVGRVRTLVVMSVTENFPLASISGVSMKTGLNPTPTVLGLVLALLSAVNLFLAPLALVLLIAALRTEISIRNSGGDKMSTTVAIWQRGDAEEFVHGLAAVLAGLETSESAAPFSTPSSVAPDRRLRESLQELGRLFDEGIIDEDEYQLRRRRAITGL